MIKILFLAQAYCFLLDILLVGGFLASIGYFVISFLGFREKHTLGIARTLGVYFSVYWFVAFLMGGFCFVDILDFTLVY